MTYSLSIRQVAIIGGGISGLTTAYALAQAREGGAPFEEFVIEGGPRLGGVIQTEPVDGFIVEGGPDSFISEKPEAAELCRELGLGDSLIGSRDRERRTYILHEGRLLPLPEGLMMLAPSKLWPFVNSPLLPLADKFQIVNEWFTKPSGRKEADESVGDFVRRHFGSAMLENIAEPLLAGVYGGDAERLSVASVLPSFVAMERVYGSLVRAGLAAGRLRTKAARRSASSDQPEKKSLFVTLKGGLCELIEALRQRLEPRRVMLGRKVIAVERVSGGDWRDKYRIGCEDGESFEADAVVLALPAHECARLLQPLHAGLASSFSTIPYSSAMTVTLGYGEGVAESLPPGFGFLVPKKENRPLLACTFVHKKFPYRAPEGKAMLRCFLGGARNPEVLGLSDDEILNGVRQELASILHLEAEPLFWRVSRWPSAMAQYIVGHQANVDRIRGRMAGFPRLYMAGNAYSGIGLSDCIRTARQTAEQVLKM